jgi:hypothetical protein
MGDVAFLTAGSHQVAFGASEDAGVVNRLIWGHDMSAKPELFWKSSRACGYDRALGWC